MKKRRIILAGLGAALLLGLFLLSSFLNREEESLRLSTFSMGSPVQQTIWGPKEALSAAAGKVNELEQLISPKSASCELEKLCAAGSNGAELDPRTWKILQVCRDVSEHTGGAFDATIAPVSSLWGFGGETDAPGVPDSRALAEALELVDYTALSLPGENRAALAEGSRLELGAAGKGAACDAVLESWKESGVKRGVAAVGGSVGLYGSKGQDKPWTVAVRDPSGSTADSLGTLSLEKGCVSTSGDYEKCFTENGVTYHHILDPKTGFPADSGLISVTVWRGEQDGIDGLLTDILSTACFVLGVEQSLPVLEHYRAEAVFVTREKAVLVTPGLEREFALTAEGYTREALP